MLRARLSDERGFTLIELLAAMAIFMFVLGAALFGLQTMQAAGSRNTKLNESQQAARLASDTITSDLRNLASPTASQPQAIDRATPTDLIFKVVNKNGSTQPNNPANVMRVRYCLETNGAHANQILWRQIQVWGDATPAVPANATACPDTTNYTSGTAQWTDTAGNPSTAGYRMASNLVNDPSTDAPFSYNSATLTQITRISTSFIVDVNSSTQPPAQVGISSGIFLRNQNLGPTASFTTDPATGAHKMRLNATASSDPEGGVLDYYWYIPAAAGDPAPVLCPSGTVPSGFGYPEVTPLPAGQAADKTQIRGVAVADYQFPTAGTFNVTLVVKDTGGDPSHGLLACKQLPVGVP
jgi:prepilin-type N-terminal cleavage/methylation domain-containing protein